MDNRGVSPVVEKLVAIGLVALFTAGLTATVLNGVVPDYQRAVGQDVGDRVLAAASDEIERAVPNTDTPTSVHREHDLPATIGGEGYRFRLSNRTLTLEHPDPSIGKTSALGLPDSVTVRDGNWSGGRLVVSVTGSADNRTLSVRGADS